MSLFYYLFAIVNLAFAQIDHCRSIGGQWTSISSHRVCVAENVIIDSSCLGRPATARKIVSAITEMKAHASSCLVAQDLPGNAGGSHVLSRLQSQYNDQVRTQICCGTRCHQPVYPSETTAPSSPEMVYADTKGIHGERHGSIRLFRRALSAPDATLERILFHEFLHRAGVARGEIHNMARPDWLHAVLTSQQQQLSGPADECRVPRGATLPPGTRLAQYEQQGRWQCCVSRQASGDIEDGSHCLRDRFDLVAMDPIYACQRVCYGTPSELPGDAALCRWAGNYGDSNGFRGQVVRIRTIQ